MSEDCVGRVTKWPSKAQKNAACQDSSCFNLTTVIGSRPGCFRVPLHTLEVCHSLGMHHPSWQYLGVHCQLIDCLSVPWAPRSPYCLSAPLMLSQAIFQQGECPHIQASRVCYTFEALWELLASNCAVSLECDVAGGQGEETCCCNMSERFTISSRAPGPWLWMWRARLALSEAQGMAVLLLIAH